MSDVPHTDAVELAPRLTMPSHGGVANPRWQYNRGCDLAERIRQHKAEQKRAERARRAAQQDERPVHVVRLPATPRKATPLVVTPRGAA